VLQSLSAYEVKADSLSQDTRALNAVKEQLDSMHGAIRKEKSLLNACKEIANNLLNQPTKVSAGSPSVCQVSRCLSYGWMKKLVPWGHSNSSWISKLIAFKLSVT